MLARWGNMGRGVVQPTRQITRDNVIQPHRAECHISISVDLAAIVAVLLQICRS